MTRILDEAPVITHVGTIHTDSVETHPAYGQIGASRVSGEANLYGSDFTHRHYVRIQIHTSSLTRNLSHDWHHAERELIEVSLSEAQWASFVSTLNVGMGVPCTIERVAGEQRPGIAHPPQRKQQFTQEVTDHLKLVEAQVTELGVMIDGTSLSQKAKDVLRTQLIHIHNNLTPNLTFVGEQFAKHVETITEHAKIEVGAFVQAAVVRAGLTALGSPLLLEEGKLTDDD